MGHQCSQHDQEQLLQAAGGRGDEGRQAARHGARARPRMVEMMAATTIRDVEICRDHLAQALARIPKHSHNPI